MATITASATGGLWTATTAWVGGVVPTSTDDVILAATSGPLTISSGSQCRNCDASAYTNTLTHSAGVNIVFYGSLVFGASMTYTLGSTVNCPIQFLATTTGNTIDFGGKTTAAPITFNGIGGGWTLLSGMSAANAGNTITVTNGSLHMGSVVINTYSISSTNTNVRTVDFGTGTHILSGVDFTISTNLTVLHGTGGVIGFYTTASNKNFYGGGMSYQTVSWTPSAVLVVTGANTYVNLSVTPGSGTTTGGATFTANQTITGTLTMTGASANRRCYMRSATRGVPITLTAAALSAANADFEDVVGAGAANWDLSLITGRSGDFQGNSGIIFSVPGTVTTLTGNTSLSTYGGLPLGQDTLRMGSAPGSAKVFTIDYPRVGTVDFSAASGGGSYSITGACMTYGDLILGTGVGNGGSNTGWTCAGKAAHVITTNGAPQYLLTIDCVNGVGSYTQQDNLLLQKALQITSGTLNSGVYTTQTNTTIGQSGGAATFAALTALSGTSTLTGGTMTLSSGASHTLQGFTISGATVNINGPLTCTAFIQNSGTINLGASLFTASTSWAQFNGTFTDGGGGVTSPYVSSTGAGVRSIIMAGPWTVTGTGTVWNIAGSNFTLVRGTSTISITDTSATAKIFAGGGMTYWNVIFAAASGNGTITLSGSNVFNSLGLSPYASVLLTTGTTQTMQSQFQWRGSLGASITIASTTAVAANVSCSQGILDNDYLSLTKIVALGTSKFYAGSHANDNGGNTNWIFSNAPHNRRDQATMNRSATRQMVA